jgi:hypothetical protein
LALIGAYDEEPRKQNPNCRPGVQRYLAYLETTVDGEPGIPRAHRESFEPVESVELVDGPVVAPPPEKPARKRKPARKADMPAPDRDSANLARYARKITGRE